MRVKEKIKNVPDGRKEHSIPIDVNPENLHDLLVEETKKYNQRVIDADFIERWQPYSDDEQTILYIGALINTKGMGELLAMAPHLILQRPGLKFIFCGFGTYREHMSQLLNAFEEGDLQKAKTIANTGDFITEIKIEDFFFKIDKKIKDRIMLVGYTEHNLLSKILPLCTICVVPSRLPEAFGMVTVESMAAGVLPICNNHTGLSDVLDLIEREFPELTSITRVKKEDFFKNLPQIILELLKFREVYSEGNQKLKERIRAISVNNFSWGAIAKKLG